MARTVYLVSCVSKKLKTQAPAHELYTSDWFRKARSYVIDHLTADDTWYILSAKYGLLEPEQVIEPYEKTLNGMSNEERLAWGESVMAQLAERLRPGDRVIFFAGQRYRETLEIKIRLRGCSVDVPMRGLGIGEQLRWLRQSCGSDC